jgi:integrase
MSDFTTRRHNRQAKKPAKPYPMFPLTPHPSGKWCKKIRGTVHYFGQWAKRLNGELVAVDGDGWKNALELYKAVADDLHAGRSLRPSTDAAAGLTVADLCNHFRTAKLRQLQAGEIGQRMYDEYVDMCDRLIAMFGAGRLVADLHPDDFAKLRTTFTDHYGPVRVGNLIQQARTAFKYAFDAGLIPAPVRFGPEFKKPSASVLRRHRAKNGTRMIDAADLRKLIDAADEQLQAMALLALNCGFGNGDVAALPLNAVNLDAGWIDFARPKTGIRRRCKLWPETVDALRTVLANRREPLPEAKDFVFVGERGRPWILIREGNRTDLVAVTFTRFLRSMKMHKPRFGFYTLRHVHRTIADGAKDPVAANYIMGHVDGSMAATYTHGVDDDRLAAVADHVRKWLFASAEAAVKSN